MRADQRRGRGGPLVLVAILAVSCGGAGDGARATTPTESAAPSTSPTTSSTNPPDAPASTSTSSTNPPANTVTAESIQLELDDLRDESAAPGVLALVRAGDEEWFASSGTADLDGTPIQPSTRFRIGSITKTLTSALVLDAVARGEVALDDTVQMWLPDVLPGEPAITIRMLLNHTSGIFNAGDEGDVLADIQRISDPSLREQAHELTTRYLAGEMVIVPDVVLVALAGTHPLYFEPGTGYHYSNVNYHLAAMVIEAVTGQEFASVLRDRMTVPLGLSSTTSAPADLEVPELRSYTKDVGTGELLDTSADLLAVGKGGSGGVVSTADELLDALQAIVAGDMLPQPLVAQMVRPTEQSQLTYGLGVVTFALACGDYLGHGGAIAGTHTLALVSPDGGTGVVLAANLRGDPEPNLLAAAEALLCGLP